MTSHRLHSPLAVALFAAAALLLPVASADAGTYSVYACKAPDGTPAPWSGWSYSSTGPESNDANYCGKGSFRILFQRAAHQHAPNDVGRLTFTAPADTSIAGYELWSSVRVLPSKQSNYSYALLEGRLDNPIETCEGYLGCGGFGDPNDPKANSNLLRREGLRDVRQLWMDLGCRGFVPCEQYTADAPAKLWLFQAEIQLKDNRPPEFVAPPHGPLLRSDAPLAGIANVSVAAADRGGGVREAVAEIDGQAVARETLGSGSTCHEPFTEVVPCDLQASGTLAVNTAKLPDGEHSLRVVVTDATGSNSAIWGPLPIHTANACQPSHPAGGSQMHLAIDSKEGARRAVTTRFGRRLSVRGGLTNAAGAPLAGELVCLGSRDRNGILVEALAWARTDAAGHFRARLPGGPSRKVFAVNRGAAGIAMASVRVRVHAGLRLHPSKEVLHNGDTLRLNGVVRGAKFADPPLVELQAWRGPYWQTFGTVRAKSSGRFSYPYEFSRTTGVQHYQLRAHVAEQGGFPYLGGSSKAIEVTVRG